MAAANLSVKLPKVYMACGLQNGLIGVNCVFWDLLAENEVDVAFEEAEGNHNWAFWNGQLAKVLGWLPLEDGNAGLNSGNVDVESERRMQNEKL